MLLPCLARGRAAWLPRVVVVLTLGLAAGCSSGDRLPPGERLVRSKCGACHSTPRPGDHDRQELGRLLEEHARRFPLEEAQRRLLLERLAR
jgi:hypothetical protein